MRNSLSRPNPPKFLRFRLSYQASATLYCVLTGTAPFRGKSVDAIVEASQHGTFRHPRAVDPNIPAELEAVCLGAMVHEPSERYASADALKEDVERWLADEPVSAKRDSIVKSGNRFLRRHRGVTLAALVLLTAVTTGLTIFWKHAANEAETQRQRADELDPERSAQRLDELGAKISAYPNLAEEPWLQVDLSHSPDVESAIDLLGQHSSNLNPCALIRSLDLSDTATTDDTLVRVSKFVFLEELKLDNTKVTDAGMTELHNLKQLRIVSLRRTSVSLRKCNALYANLPRCRVLVTSRRYDDGHVSGELTVIFQSDSDKGLSITVERTGNCSADVLVAEIASLTTVTSLDLANTGLTDAECCRSS